MVPGRASAASCMASPRRSPADAVLEDERARRHERGVLAEAVAGDGAGLDTEALDRVEHDQAGHEGGQLGVAGGASARRRRPRAAAGPRRGRRPPRPRRPAPRTGGRPRRPPCRAVCDPWPGNVKAIIGERDPSVVVPVQTRRGRQRFHPFGSRGSGPVGPRSVPVEEGAPVTLDERAPDGGDDPEDAGNDREAADPTGCGRLDGVRSRPQASGRPVDRSVRRVGFEPTRPGGQRGLSPPCMPVPAPPRAARPA